MRAHSAPPTKGMSRLVTLPIARSLARRASRDVDRTAPPSVSRRPRSRQSGKPPESCGEKYLYSLWGNSPQGPVLRFTDQLGDCRHNARVEGVAEGGVLTRQVGEYQLRCRVDRK